MLSLKEHEGRQLSQGRPIGLQERLAEIGGQLQKLRWDAQDQGDAELARNIALAVDAIAWAAGIYAPDHNVVEPPKMHDGDDKSAQDARVKRNSAAAAMPKRRADVSVPCKPCAAA